MLTAEEITLLDAKLHPLSFAALLSKWREFVGSLDGYGFSIYDYDNDIDARALIQEAAEACPVHIQVKTWAALREFDEAFLTQTAPRLRARYPVEGWHSRLPKNPGEDILSDIQAGNV